MKKFILSLVIILFFYFPYHLYSQNQCGFIAPQDMEVVSGDYTGKNYQLFVQFHVLRRTDGTGGATYAKLGELLSELNTVYATAGISFDSVCTVFIDNDLFFNNCALFDQKRDSIFRSGGSNDIIGIFIVNPSGCPAFGVASSLNCYAVNPGHRNLVSHEVGHVLNLLHTFQRSATEFSCFSDPDPAAKGDLCGDTPPDPSWLDGIFTNCQWDQSKCDGSQSSYCKDDCLDKHQGFNPGIMMSYYHDCTSFFTTCQQNRMKFKLETSLHNSHFDLPQADVIIKTPVTWTKNMYINKNLILQAGAILTVKDSVFISSKGKIRIEPGATLVLDGGALLLGPFRDVCNERSGDSRFWKGIEMVPSASTPSAKFLCYNGVMATSELGIHTPAGSTGNYIININGMTFQDNAKSLLLMNPAGMTYPIQIENSSFTITNAFPLTSYSTQIKVDKCNVILINCKFLKPGKNKPTDELNYAVNVMNTVLNVSYSQFRDSIYGIKAQSFLDRTTFSVTNSSFVNCKVGIRAMPGLNFYKVVSDTFDNPIQYGLWSTMCTGYLVNNNSIINTAFNTNNQVGIYMEESGTDFNYVRLNHYRRVYRGNLTNGTNGNQSQGLQFLCNDFDDNQTRALDITGNICPFQGFSDGACGNHNLQNQKINLYFTNCQRTFYHYKDTFGHFPSGSTSIVVPIVESKVDCGGSGQDTMIKPRIIVVGELGDSLTQKRQQYSGLMDGGNTATVLSGIQTATLAGSSQLYNSLLGYSPWLSSEAMLAAYSRSDVLDPMQRYSLLLANPDNFRSDSFRTALRSSPGALPLAQLEALDSLSMVSTARTNLEAELAHFAGEIAHTSYAALHDSRISSTAQTQDCYWLEKLAGPTAAKESAKMNLSCPLSNNYSSHPDVQNTQNLRAAMAVSIAQGRYEGSLTVAEQSQILTTAGGSSLNTAETQAMLMFYYGFPSTSALASNPKENLAQSIGERPMTSSPLATEILVYPNPAHEHIHIQTAGVGTEQGLSIVLLDLQCKKLLEERFAAGSHKISTSRLPQGMYLVQIRSHEGSILYQKLHSIVK
ncbi:MAG TPA: T9SS type A sorting domain-containing protein [Saprospiraceae bacterium]|nr:T9SS type A sorting domain-containing protein [Saprospiraceae bacterium]